MEILNILLGSFIAFILYSLYCLVRNWFFNYIKFYFILVLLITIVIPVYKTRDIDLDEFISYMMYFIMVLFLYQLYKRDKQRKELFQIHRDTSVYPIWLSGISVVELDSVPYYHEKLQTIYEINKRCKKKIVAFISYDKIELRLNLIMLHPDDYMLYDSQVFKEGIEVVEKSSEGKGGSMILKITE